MASQEGFSARRGCATGGHLIARSLTSFCVAGILAAVLVTLAVMEYRWANTVSEASRERMQSNLRIALNELRVEFQNEIVGGSFRAGSFPELVRRHFRAQDLIDYDVAVLNGTPHEQLIFASAPGLSVHDFSDPDERLSLPGPVSGFLVAKRHRGSLSEAVESLRLRCLAINFGVLLILGLGTMMLVISSFRAQTLLRLQMEFVASVSHELRTPLSVIGSAADNLAEGVVRSERSVREYGSLIRGECRRLSQLVEQTLQFAAGKANYRSREVEFLRVEDALDQVLEQAAAVLDANGFTVEKNIDPDLPKIRVNMTSFSECLLNLISNAVKYGAQSQWMGIRAQPFETGRGTGVTITVEDRGPGIPSEELAQIFEPFYRGRHARSAQIRGTGLGLSLAQEAAAAMGARITVESAVGEGSAFTIHMPASSFNSTTIPLEAIVES